MDNIQSNPMLLTESAPKSYLRVLLSQWLQWAPGDGRGSTGFATRESLRAALLRANLGQLAQLFNTPSEGDQSHERSRDPAPQHSGQAERRDECTVNGMYIIILIILLQVSPVPPGFQGLQAGRVQIHVSHDRT